jgi:hypothetical protein
LSSALAGELLSSRPHRAVVPIILNIAIFVLGIAAVLPSYIAAVILGWLLGAIGAQWQQHVAGKGRLESRASQRLLLWDGVVIPPFHKIALMPSRRTLRN